MHPRAAELIDIFQLERHPEGGYFREVFRSPHIITPSDTRGARSVLTAIYFLLTAGEHSRWHRILSDEVWHFYEGDTAELFIIDKEKQHYTAVLLGHTGKSAKLMQVVPAGRWQAARTTGEYSLAGCTVAPGFEFDDFSLLSQFPEEETTIRRRFPELAALM